MKIIYKQGNLVNCTETYLAHGCNCQGKMGKGVAKDVRTMFPKAYYDYLLALQKGGLHLGDVIISDDKILAIYLPSALWPIALILATLYLFTTGVSKAFDSWTTNLANFFKKDK